MRPETLRLRSCVGVDGGFREAASDYHTAREPRPQVRGTQPEQLPIGVHLILVLGSVGLGRPEPLCESDQGNADR